MKIDELTLDLLAFLSGRINRLEVEPSDERRGGIVSLTTRPWRRQDQELPHQRERGGVTEVHIADFSPFCILRVPAENLISTKTRTRIQDLRASSEDLG